MISCSSICAAGFGVDALDRIGAPLRTKSSTNGLPALSSYYAVRSGPACSGRREGGQREFRLCSMVNPDAAFGDEKGKAAR
jgi:hypothetical protein